MEFFEAPTFSQYLPEYLNEDAYREFQNFIFSQPEAGDMIQGTGGFRKVRWTDPRRGKGKRGGLRIIYYYFNEDEQIWFLTIYDKNQADDLSPQQRKALKGLIDAEKEARTHKKHTKGS
jgi:mRNA-degrading endonuclease RelE of RelBE toxin-antitoxin system